MQLRSAVCVLSLFAGFATAGPGDSLSAAMTVDNTFSAYLSNDPNVQGTEFLSGGSWPTTYQTVVSLDEPGTYYLQVRAFDSGSPEMFIGKFSLAGSNALFANGTQELLTLADSGDWTASATGFGGPEIDVIDVGTNGTAPWGTFALMGDARFIWAGASPTQFDTVYFTASFTVLPAPGSVAAMGLVGLAAARRRR